MELVSDLDLCPQCGVEGDPIQAINCLPVKWQCPDCGLKWNKERSIEEQENITYYDL